HSFPTRRSSDLNILNIDYEFDTMKSFPDDMPSRVGYDILETEFEKGDLAPTTVLFETDVSITEDENDQLIAVLSDEPLVSNVRQTDISDNEQAISYQMTFKEGPYDVETMNALERIRDRSEDILDEDRKSTRLNSS